MAILDFIDSEAESNSNGVSTDTASILDSIVPNSGQQRAQVNPYADMLSGLTGATNPQISTQQIGAPQNDYEKRIAAEQAQNSSASPVQDFYTYYPSMKNDVLKGMSLGPMTGSHGNYAPSGLYPYGLIDARQNALKSAADKKAAEMDAYRNKIQANKAPVTKRTNVQGQITQDFYKGMNEFVDKARKDNPNADPYKSTYNNPEFHSWLQAQNDRVANETAGVESAAKFSANAEKAGNTVFQPQQEFLKKYLSGESEKLISSTDPKEREEGWSQMQKLHNLQAMPSVETVTKQIKDTFEPDDIESLQGISHQGLYDMVTTGSTKGVKTPAAAARLKDYLHNVYESTYAGREDQTGFNEDKFIKQATGIFGTTTKKTVQTVSTKDAEDFHMDENSLAKAPVSITSSTGQKGAAGEDKSAPFSMLNSYDIPAKSQTTFEMTIPSDAKDIDGEIVRQGIKGNVSAKIAKVGNSIIVHKSGSKADGKAIEESSIDNYKKAGFKFSVVPQASVTVIGYDDKGKVAPGQNSTIAVGLNSIQNNVTKFNPDGSYKSGVNTPLLQKLAHEKEAELNIPPSSTKYTDAQESLIKKNMEANPDYDREEVIKLLNIK